MKKLVFLLVISFCMIISARAKDIYNYKILYYYDGILDKEETIINSAPESNIIKSYKLKPKENYILDYTSIDDEGLQISNNENNNLIKVYYTSENTKAVFDMINKTIEKNQLIENIKLKLNNFFVYIDKLLNKQT